MGQGGLQVGNRGKKKFWGGKILGREFSGTPRKISGG